MIIISPAKKLNLSSLRLSEKTTQPVFLKKTNFLVNKLKQLKVGEIKSLMKISDDLAELNHSRFKDFSLKNNDVNSKPSVFTFSGDTYKGLEISSFSSQDIIYAQKRLRILSGLYGLLRPLDKIQAYRLEMGTKTDSLLKKSLYSFWSDIITKEINEDIKINNSKTLFNLSSSEYFKSINRSDLIADVITPSFYKLKNGNLQSLGMLSKICRGSMAKMILKKRITCINGLKKFKFQGFNYDSMNTNDKSIIFIKKDDQ